VGVFGGEAADDDAAVGELLVSYASILCVLCEPLRLCAENPLPRTETLRTRKLAEANDETTAAGQNDTVSAARTAVLATWRMFGMQNG
jgi:hypothetical protein